MAGASLTPIYERLRSAGGYHPMSANTFSDWSVEAGDIVTLRQEGKEYRTPVYNSNLTWRGKQEIAFETTGNEKRESVSRVSQEKFNSGRGSGGLRSNKALWWEMTSEDGILHASISATESQLRTEYTDGYNRLSGTITQTASELRTEYTDGYNRLESSITQTASEIRLEVAQTASGLSGRITVNADKVSVVVDDKYRLKTASIVAEINESGSNVRIDAEKVYIGNQKSTTVINGKLEATDITADFLNARIAKIPTMTGISASFSGNVTAKGGVTGARIYVGNKAPYVDISNAVAYVRINGQTLQYKRFLNTNWEDGGTFDRAIASWDGSGWSGGTYTAHANPQNQEISTTLQNLSGTGNVSRSGVYVSRVFKVQYGPDEDHLYDTGYSQSVTIDAGDVYDYGWREAAEEMDWPHQISGQSDVDEISIFYPKSDGSTDEYVLKLSKDSSGCYITHNNTLLAKISM